VIRGLGRAKRILRHVKRQFKPAAVILMYHRVADVPVDPRGTAISPENFAQHLDYVRRTCQPMRLLDLVEALQTRSLPRRAVAITFDDGHVSISQKARPLLASVQIPATAFIVTATIDNTRGFWWDELDRVLLFPKNVPDYLDLLAGAERITPSDASLRDTELGHRSFQAALGMALCFLMGNQCRVCCCSTISEFRGKRDHD